MRGFTLIEVMLTVAIVAVLSAIALPRMGRSVRAAAEGRSKANLAIVRHALMAYYGDYQQFPTDHLGDLIDKGYLRSIPSIWEPPYHAEGNGVCVATSIDVNNLVACSDAYVYVNDSNSPQWGTVVLSCIHQDLKGRPWSTY